MSELRKIDVNADTTEIVDKVLDMCPTDCVKDRGRLCIRISTIVARAEHAYKFGKSEDEIMQRAAEGATTAGDYCNGITITDGRTECGHGKSSPHATTYPEWMVGDGNV